MATARKRAPNPSKTRTQVGRPPIAPGTLDAEAGRGLLLPHERDQHQDATADEPNPVIAQAQRDIENGLVDTDLRTTPGLDAPQRQRLLDQEKARSRRRSGK